MSLYPCQSVQHRRCPQLRYLDVAVIIADRVQYRQEQVEHGRLMIEQILAARRRAEGPELDDVMTR